MMDLVGTKVLAMVLLGLFSILIGFIPLKLRRHLGWGDLGKDTGRKRIITSLLLCFGGGVLLATSFVHMLPEVRDNLVHSGYHSISKIPLAEVLLCGGFFLIYFIEEIVHYLTSFREDDDVDFNLDTLSQLQRTFSLRGSSRGNFPANNQDRNARKKDQPNEGDEGRIETTGVESPSLRQFNPKYAGQLKPSAKAMFPNYHSPDEEDGSRAKKNPRQRPIRDFLTVLALSFHSLFEGLVIGLESTVGDVWTLFAAISTHKFVIIFCVGLELVTAGTAIAFFCLYVVTFALISPVGIGIGIAIAEGSSSGVDQGNHYLAVGILQGIAAGTILYIVVFEVLQREKAKMVSGLLQLGFVLLGFSVMLGIELIGGHMHEHGLLTTQNSTASTTTMDHHAMHHAPLLPQSINNVDQQQILNLNQLPEIHLSDRQARLRANKAEVDLLSEEAAEQELRLEQLHTEHLNVKGAEHIHLPEHKHDEWTRMRESGVVRLEEASSEGGAKSPYESPAR